MTSRVRVFLVIGAVAMFPVCFLHIGQTGDDFVFHLHSWLEFLNVWRSGVMFPSWAPATHFTLGEPRFLFYPPLSFMLGAVLSAVLPFYAVQYTFVWLSLLLAGLAMFKLSTMFLDRASSLLAACLYICSYYLVVDVLLRFAAAELLTATLLPLIVLFYLRLTARQSVRDGALLSLCFAGVWLTDAPEAIAIFYALLACGVIDFAIRREAGALFAPILAQITAILMSAWYLLPVFLYRQNISTEKLMVNNWRDHLLFRVPPRYFAVPLRSPLWIWAIGCAVFIICMAWTLGQKQEGNARLHLRMLACIGFIALFVQTPLSAPMWTYLPELRFVQFPFRFDIFLGCVLPIVFLMRFRSKLFRSALIVVWLVMALAPISKRVVEERQHHEFFTSAVVEATVASGYKQIHEYLPVGARSDGEPVDLPQVAPQQGGQICRFQVERWLPEQRSFHSVSGSGCVYQVALIYYPDWKELLDGRETDSLQRSDDGLVVATVPAGEHEVTVYFKRPPAFAVGGVISLVTLLGVLMCLYRVKSTAQSDENLPRIYAQQTA